MNDETPNSVKELVIYSLSQNWPATVRTLHEIIEKKRPGVSYHAVHKACRQLVHQGVLKREKNAYTVSSDWIQNLCDFTSRLKANYAGQKPVNLPILREFREGDAQTFVFDNLEEADTYRKRLQWEYLTLEGEKKPYCAISRHLRSPLFSSERALNIMNMATKAKSEAFMIVAGDTEIDRWCADYYRGEFVRVQTGVPCAEVCDTMILGDIVVQLHLPEELRAKLESTYINTENAANLNVSEFYTSMYKRLSSIRLTVMKNAEIAQQLRDQIMAHFAFKKVAIFDINGTLVDEFLIKIFAEYLALNGRFDKKNWEEMEMLRLSQKKGDIEYDRYIEKIMDLYAEGLKGQPMEEIKSMARRFVEEGRVPIFRQSRRLFNWVNSYYRTLAITKTTEEIMEALKAVFAFDDVLASQLEMRDGKCTGKIKRHLGSKNAKLSVFKSWLKENCIDLKGSIAFGDMYHDFAFLESVETPVLLDPSAKDASFARKKKWLVFDRQADTNDIIAAIDKR